MKFETLLAIFGVGLILTLFSCGKINRTLYDTDAKSLMSELSNMDIYEYCSPENYVSKNITQSEKLKDLSDASPEKKRGFSAFLARFKKKKPKTQPFPIAPIETINSNFIDHYRIEYGHGSNPQDHSFGKGGGCIFRPIKEVWAVAHNYQLMKWDGADEEVTVSHEPLNNETYLLETFYLVRNVVNMTWTMVWTHGLLAGTKENPENILIKYERTASKIILGKDHIPYWQGQFQLIKLSDNVTGFVGYNKVLATRTDDKDSGSTIADIIEKLKKGSPNWDALK